MPLIPGPDRLSSFNVLKIHMEPKLFVATKAFINYRGKILILRESNTYQDGTQTAKYDVAGGRLTPGEKFDEALKREILEETGLDVEIGKPFYVGEWRPVVRDEQWQIIGICFECFAKSEEVVLSGDHDAFEWIDPRHYEQYPIIGNFTPAFEAYINK